VFCIVDFFPFGIGNGDQVGPHEIDSSTGKIPLSEVVTFYQKDQSALYVSSFDMATVNHARAPVES